MMPFPYSDENLGFRSNYCFLKFFCWFSSSCVFIRKPNKPKVFYCFGPKNKKRKRGTQTKTPRENQETKKAKILRRILGWLNCLVFWLSLIYLFLLAFCLFGFLEVFVWFWGSSLFLVLSKHKCSQLGNYSTMLKHGTFLPPVVVASEKRVNKRSFCYFSYFELCLQEGISKRNLYVFFFNGRESSKLFDNTLLLQSFYEERRKGSSWGG